MQNLKKMGAIVREEREKLNLSLTDLGRRVGVDRTLISKIENGRYRPTPPILERFVQEFSLDTERAHALWALSGRISVPVTKIGPMEAFKMTPAPQVRTPQPDAANISINPSTPILFSDGVAVSSSDYGMVFDFGQRLGPTNNINIVARIGVSHEHARKIMEAIHNELERNEK